MSGLNQWLLGLDFGLGLELFLSHLSGGQIAAAYSQMSLA